MVVLLLNGCAEAFYRTGLDRRTYYNINLKNGVSQREAIIIAQRTLLNSKYSNDYCVSKPIVGFDEKYNLWGVSFRPKKNGYDECGYTVMINQAAGEIKEGCFSGL
jgi:hypothetical protein